MTDEKNEFEDLEEEVPKEFSEVPKSQSDILASGTPGTVYDWSKAPEGVKAPPRADLNGKEVVIKKADLVLPPMNTPWSKTRDGTKDVKYCSFILYYDTEGQQEFYSGTRVFNREGKYSHPTITKDRNNQASRLMGLYADYKGKDLNEVSLREFMGFLNSQPKALIKAVEVENPETNDKVNKNMVAKFL